LSGCFFASTAINYINRQTLSVLAPEVSKQFHLSHSDLSRIFGSFQFSYAVMWLVGGLFLDVAGTRLGLSLARGVVVARKYRDQLCQLRVFFRRAALSAGHWQGIQLARRE
jgi:fucose permease